MPDTRVFSITDFGAVTSDFLMTEPIQNAIDTCHEAGGGIVEIPEGTFRIGSLFLKSNVTLHLLSGAELEGSRNPDDYTGTGRRWYHAVITAENASHIAIIGERYSRINGMNCYDPSGEERYRGPHGIVLKNCTDVTLSGYTVKDSGNWAHALFHCKDMHIHHVTVYGGHDGIDIHCCEDTVIEACSIHTGDDGIAGFGNERCTVRDCILDTSCSAMRFGGKDCTFERCVNPNPSTFGHRWGMSEKAKSLCVNDGRQTRHGTGVFFRYYCDTRWMLTHTPGNIVFRDCTADHFDCLFELNYSGRDQWCCYKPLTSVVFENCTLTNAGTYMRVLGDPDQPVSVTFRNCRLSVRPESSADPLATLYNVNKLLLEQTVIEGYDDLRVITRSPCTVTVIGGTPVRVDYKPDPNDIIFTFAEIREKLSALPADEAAWAQAANAIPEPQEADWDQETSMYRQPDTASAHTVWGSVMAVLKGATRHGQQISHSCVSHYGYYVGSDNTRNSLVYDDINGTPSDIFAGPFAYAMALDVPLTARAFITDFLRSRECTPAAVAGMKLAVEKLFENHIADIN